MVHLHIPGEDKVRDVTKERSANWVGNFWEESRPELETRKYLGGDLDLGLWRVTLLSCTRGPRLVFSHPSPHTRPVITSGSCHLTAKSVTPIPELPSPWNLVIRTRDLRLRRKGQLLRPSERRNQLFCSLQYNYISLMSQECGEGQKWLLPQVSTPGQPHLT